MRRPVDDDELFWLGGLLVLFANAREARPVSVRVVAGDDEKAGGFEPGGGKVGRVGEKDEAIDGAGRCGNGCIAGGPATHAGSDDGDGFCPMLAQVTDGGQNVEMERGAERIRLAGAAGVAEAAEIEGEDAKSRCGEGAGLRGPAPC